MDRDTPMTGDAFFRDICQGVPEAIIVAAPDGTIGWISPEAERLLGHLATDIAGRNITMLVPPQPDRPIDAMKWLERWAHEPADTQSRFLDFPARRKDGTTIPVDVRVAEHQVGGARNYLITFRDNTARRREQAAFKEASLRALRILQIAEDGIVSLDADQNITFFNLKAETMFGWRAEEVIGRPLIMLMPQRFRDGHAAMIGKFAASREASRAMNARGEVSGLRRSGEEFPLEVAITKVTSGGTITFTAHMRDISARKRDEERLKESEQRFRAIFDHAFEAIGLLAPDGTVLEFNRSARLLMEGLGATTGLPIWELPWVGADREGNEEPRQRLRAAVAQAATGVRVAYAANLAPPGEAPREIAITLTPVTDLNGKVLYIVPEGRLTAKLGSEPSAV